MSYELIYTSAPHGLKPGSRGFCTVAQSEGLPAAAAMICESLSGYTHLYDLQDPRYPQNPVAWSHLVGRVQGGAVSILSRVSSLRADYTGRTNKIAHHRILSSGERQPCGPAEILRRPGTFRDDWNEQPALLKPVILPGIREPASCRAELWQQLAGDAGLAGEIAQSFLDNPARPCFVIYEPGTDVLGLFAEALNLLPPSARWQVGFTTYFSGLPAGMECTWRGCPVGSEAAEAAVRTANGLVVDLRSGSVGGARAVNTALLDAARTGIRHSSVDTEREIVSAPSGYQADGDESAKARAEPKPSRHNREPNQRAVQNQRVRSPVYAPPAGGGGKHAYKIAAIAAIALIATASITAYILLDDRAEVATTNKVEAVHEIERSDESYYTADKQDETVPMPVLVSTNQTQEIVIPPPPPPPAVVAPVARKAALIVGASLDMPEKYAVKFYDRQGGEIMAELYQPPMKGSGEAPYYHITNGKTSQKTRLAEIRRNTSSGKTALIIPDDCATNMLCAVIESEGHYQILANDIPVLVEPTGKSMVIKLNLIGFNEVLPEFVVEPMILPGENYTALVHYKSDAEYSIQTNTAVKISEQKIVVDDIHAIAPKINVSTIENLEKVIADLGKHIEAINAVIEVEEKYKNVGAGDEKAKEKENLDKQRKKVASEFAQSQHSKVYASLPQDKQNRYGNAVLAGGRTKKDNGGTLYQYLGVDQYNASLSWPLDGLRDLAISQQSLLESNKMKESEKINKERRKIFYPVAVQILEGGREIMKFDLPETAQTFNQNANQ